MALPDFECIRIRTLHLKLAEDLLAPKQTVLEALGLRVNLYSMVTVKVKTGVVKLLKEAPSNNRYTKWRAESTQKYDVVLPQSKYKGRDFAT